MVDEVPKKLSEIMDNDDNFFQAEIRIGPFKLLDQLGKGKFATVSLGIHEELKEYVAIKQIKKSELNTNVLLSKEISIQKILFHPYITKMYCVIEKEENIFIISEYCSKGDAFKILVNSEKECFEECYSCKIFQQILSSLEYLHNNNICHRDIKLENILLDEYGDAKLSDFGLSKKHEKNELLKTACGSPIYAAPEMLKGDPYKGSEVDIWSLGISLYVMVCGEFPFNEDDMKNLVYKITNGIYTIPENVSPLFKDLIKKLLEVNPKKRITIEEIKKHEWVNNFGFNYLKSPGVLLDEYYLPVDIYLIKEIEGKNEDKIKKIIEDILMNKHNINTITYYLKNEIKKREGKKSISDLRPCSELFLEYINDKKSKKNFWNNDIKKIGNYYMEQILNLLKEENLKKIEIKKEIEDSLKKEEGSNDKKSQIARFNTELKKFNNNEEKDIEKNKGINNNIKKENKLGNINIKNKFDALEHYLGPLIFVHDLLDNIIKKAVYIVNEKNKNSNYSVTPSIKVEIQQNTQNKPIENNNNISLNILDNLKEKSIRKLSYQEQFSINKTQVIELVSTPKRIKNSFSFINNVQSETIEIEAISNTKQPGRSKRSESCHIRNNKKKKENKNIKTKNNTIEKNKINNNNQKPSNSKVKNENKNQSKIIKSIDLSSKGIKNKNISSKKKNKSNSNITHLQINIIKNEIIIADNHYHEKNKENIDKCIVGLTKNYSQNYSFDVNKNICFSDSLMFKNKLINKFNSKIKNRNKIPVSKYHNKSVDLKIQKQQQKIEKPKSRKNYINIKKEIITSSNKDSNINRFLKTPNQKYKKMVPSSSSSKIISLYCPNPDKGIVKNIFINKDISNIKNKDLDEPKRLNHTSDKKQLIPLRSRKNNHAIFIKNIKKDLTEFQPNLNKYSNNYIKIKKYQELNNQQDSNLLSLFSQPNENEEKNINKKPHKTKDINLDFYKYSKSPSKENIKTEIYRNKSHYKKNKNKNDEKIIKTKLELDKIKQIIKRFVGNNVIEEKNYGNFKYACKTKMGKDDLIFDLELVKKNYDYIMFEGKLIRGETKFYKELFFKIKDKLV